MDDGLDQIGDGGLAVGPGHTDALDPVGRVAVEARSNAVKKGPGIIDIQNAEGLLRRQICLDLAAGLKRGLADNDPGPARDGVTDKIGPIEF